MASATSEEIVSLTKQLQEGKISFEDWQRRTQVGYCFV
jgi:hypothetical protein